MKCSSTDCNIEIVTKALLCKNCATRAWRRANPERVRANNQRWSNANRARHRLLCKKWRKLNPAGAKAHILTRKARLLGVGGVFTAEEWLAKLQEFGKRCPCCGKVKKLTIDHIVPLSKGGKNVIENIQPLCGRCNDSKGVRTIRFEPWL